MTASEQIKFACPNGHPLSCPKEMIGKPGKCPKCNTKFVVPDILDEDQEPAEEAPEESGGGFKIDTSSPANRGKPGTTPVAPGSSPGPGSSAPLNFLQQPAGGSAKGIAAGSGKGLATQGSSGQSSAQGTAAPPGGELIVFLCPNGHRLNGPKSLQGKPGKCPHCGAKFVIPLEEPEESSQEEESVPQGQRASDSTEVDPRDLDQLEEVDEFPTEEEASGEEEVVDVDAEDIIPETIIPPAPAGSHPLATLLARLWHQPSDERRVQIELEGGETITPEFYCREYSYTGYAVFAVRLEDGAHTVISVPWEKVTRITVRGVKELPHGLFE